MNTTTAAAQANVTVATIRSWCRRGVIAAVKQAGRWIIDAASLAHRITIGAMKNREEQPVIQPGEHIDYRVDDATVIRVTRSAWTPPGKDGYYNAEIHINGWKTASRGCGDGYSADEARRKCLDSYNGLRSDQARIDYLIETGVLGNGTLTPITGNKSATCHYCGLDARTCDCR